jgi:Cu/Ag efflux protein CusF
MKTNASLAACIAAVAMAISAAAQAQGAAMAGNASHEATGVVKGADAAAGRVTLAHEPVKSLGWPAMTMGFGVKDKTLMGKLTPGSKVQVTFRKEGNDYVVTSVR